MALTFFYLHTPGLFHRVILSGGSIFSPFALDHFPRYQTQMLAIEVGCGQHQFNGRNLLQCLREKSPSELLKVVETVKSNYIRERQLYLPDGPIPDLDFRPIIDSNRTYPLFRRNPVDMFENGEYQSALDRMFFSSILRCIQKHPPRASLDTLIHFDLFPCFYVDRLAL